MRLFVALDLPWDQREALSHLGGDLPGAWWLDADTFHLTLRFVGEVGALQAEAVDEALSGLRSKGFALTLTGVGVSVRGGRPASLWAGVERNPALDHLHGKIETALQRCGMAPERRRFTPHVTLARLDQAPQDQLAAWVAANNLFRGEAFAVRHVTLFSSQHGDEQPVYTPEVEYALG